MSSSRKLLLEAFAESVEGRLWYTLTHPPTGFALQVDARLADRLLPDGVSREELLRVLMDRCVEPDGAAHRLHQMGGMAQVEWHFTRLLPGLKVYYAAGQYVYVSHEPFFPSPGLN